MNAHNCPPIPVRKAPGSWSRCNPQRMDVPLFLKFMIVNNHEKGISRLGYTQWAYQVLQIYELVSGNGH